MCSFLDLELYVAFKSFGLAFKDRAFPISHSACAYIDVFTPSTSHALPVMKLHFSPAILPHLLFCTWREPWLTRPHEMDLTTGLAGVEADNETWAQIEAEEKRDRKHDGAWWKELNCLWAWGFGAKRRIRVRHGMVRRRALDISNVLHSSNSRSRDHASRPLHIALPSPLPLICSQKPCTATHRPLTHASLSSSPPPSPSTAIA